MLYVIINSNFAKRGKLRLAAVIYPVVQFRVRVRVMVRVRVQVKVKRTHTVGIRASNHKCTYPFLRGSLPTTINSNPASFAARIEPGTIQ